MDILLLCLNYAPEEIGIGPYSQGLAEALAQAGHRVEVVAGKPYYPEWRRRPGPAGVQRTTEGGVTIWRVPHFVPKRPSAVPRILHYLSFAAQALPVMWRRAGAMRPNLVLNVAPALMAAPVALLAARRAGALSWLHIQDFEVEAALATGMLSQGFAVRRARAFETGIISRFNYVSTISAEMMVKALTMWARSERTYELRNWAELDGVHPGIDGSRLRAELNLPEGQIALYSGNLAMKQGIGLIAEAAKLLSRRSDIHFLVCGEGSGRAALAEAVAGLANVSLRPLQPRERLGELLAIADLHLLPQLAAAAEAVLPSKLTNMLASGRPVVATAEEGTALHAEVAGSGIATPPGDAAAFAEAIARLLDDRAELQRLGEAARARAVERWSRQAILGEFVTAIERAAPKRG